MTDSKIDTYYFLGIGGIGMSALARYFAAKGYRVLGYDRTPSVLTRALEAEGISVQYDEDLSWVKELKRETTTIVRTPAVPEEMAVYVWLRENGFQILKRAEVLGRVTRQQKALCVAGTHGKTTTSTILAHILHQSHVGANAFLGGIANNYKTNLLLDQSDNVVVEADEFDRSFHQLKPYISVITSMDPDHLDIYGDAEAYRESFEKYAGLVERALVVKATLAQDMEKAASPQCRVYSYDVIQSQNTATQPHFYADNVRIADGEIRFDFHTPEHTVADVELGVPVWVNIENGVAAMAVAWLMGATDDELRNGMRTFSGVYRRFNIHVNTPRVVYVDDYAHHPMELEACIKSVRRLCPDRYVIGVFQPHLFTRTRDFAPEFAAVLSTLDEVVLLPIYPAREQPISGVTSDWLMSKMTMENGMKTVAIVEKADLANHVLQRVTQVAEPVVVITMGAGDIDRCVEKVKEQLILNCI